ncbi:MAG: T9SS type A sorting domain-containing protein, partial [Ignavibacteriaceae bacterium]|nr:T9SS type A sorting domain-containing protein [Ignavibacteriaceae bacterium]
GSSWNLMYSTNYDITDFDFDSMNNIYFITFEGCLRSTDGGTNWNLFFQQYELRQIEINPNDEIYITSFQVIYQTKDSGLHWIILNGIQTQLIKSINDNNILIVDDRVYRSSDGGTYWYNMGLNISEPSLIEIFSVDSVILASYYDILVRYDPNGQLPPNIVKDNYLPLSVGNKYLYKGGEWFYPYSSNFIIYTEATSEQIIGGRRYVYVTDFGWMSYTDKDKIFYYYDNGYEYPYMDFKLPDFTLYPIKSFQNPDELFYNETHSGYVYQTNIHSKGYSFIYSEGVVSHTFAENLGYYSYSDDSPLYGNYGYYLIQALIQDSTGTQQLYDYPYDPQIVFTPITKTADSLLNFTLTVNHYFSVDTSSYILQGLNFIDTVSMNGFYVSANDTLPFSTVYGENIYGTKKFSFNVPIDINLLSSNYKLNYRIAAKDKGIVPHWDYKPSDSTYYQMILDTTVSVEDQNDLLTSFQLYQNYPNPFNPITTIKYDIIKVQDVSVTIYDILGREITVLVNEQQQPGSYEVKWDASNVSSGIYFYRLNTTDYIDTKKMILLK